MEIEELLSRVALALGIGLLIGLERGWRSRDARAGGRTAGVRTFAITGLLGGIVAAVARGANSELSTTGGVLLGAAFIAYAAVIAIFHRDENQATNTFSATTTVAALLTYMLGAYALLGDVRVAAAAAVAAAGILIVREELHQWITKITLAELESALVLLAMTFIALPVMPNRAIDSLGGINPREIWLIAIVLASVSFAGYVAVKLYGESRGILIAAAAGGLVSSTAVTFAYAKRARAHEGTPRLLAAGAALSTAVSFVRVAAIVTAIKPALSLSLGPALVAGAAVAAGFAFITIFFRKDDDKYNAAVEFKNPFGFWSVIGVAVSMAVLIVLGRMIQERFGAAGAVFGAAAMGLFDVDAMTIAMSRLVPEALSPHAGSIAILVGVASNTLSKMGIAATIGRASFAAQYAGISALCIVAGWFVMQVLS